MAGSQHHSPTLRIQGLHSIKPNRARHTAQTTPRSVLVCVCMERDLTLPGNKENSQHAHF